MQAAGCREAGRLQQAAALYRRILRAAPHQVEALHWLGLLEHQAGESEAALRHVEQAAELDPANAQCLFHLGEIRRALGFHGQAVESYRKALSHAPGVADIHFGLGSVLLELGRAEEAIPALRRAVELSPGDVEARNNLGNALAELGDFPAAIEQYRGALGISPSYAEARMNLGIALSQSGQDQAAEAAYRAAIETEPGYLEARLQLGRFLQRLERFVEAKDELSEALAIDPEWAETHNMLGRCLVKLARFDAARRHYRKAVELQPDFAEAHFNLGVCLQSEGRFDAAIAAHERALELRPGLAEAYYNLSIIKREVPQEAELERLQALAADPDVEGEARVNAEFALASLFEDRGDIGRSFSHYAKGNRLKAQSVSFHAVEHEDFADRLIATFDATFFAARQGWGAASELPVLIVGMPRSGTTLVEQILASHPAVHGAGELDDFREMVRQLPARLDGERSFPACAAEISKSLSVEMAEEYLERLRRRSPEARRITDKMPGNYVRLGLAALLLPQARVIHCRRDPRDTCLSCYFQNFAQGLSFSYDLGNLGLVYRQYERLMAHWARVLPLPILDVAYEELIENQEAVSQRIVAFCGLEWDARCLRFHETARPVRTASFWQVRQPIYKTSIGRWRAFAEHLDPLFEALGPQDRKGS